MIAAFVGAGIGVVLGSALGGPFGGALGVLLGAMLGMLWAAGTDVVDPVPAGAHVAREQHRLLCVPKGQVASATFVRDAHSGRWLDVERCSLCSPEHEVGCQKRCLLLMRDAVPARRHPVAIGA
jgi:hypothetical protein